MTETFPLIEVSGPPRERGRQFGQAAKARVHLGFAHYSRQIEKLGLGRAGVAELAHAYLPIIEAFDADYVPEMRGISEGADIDFESVVLLNARTEILQLAERPALRARLQGTKDDLDGCTAVVAMPGATADGRLIDAQNRGWKAECADTAVVLHIRSDDGPDILTFTEARHPLLGLSRPAGARPAAPVGRADRAGDGQGGTFRRLRNPPIRFAARRAKTPGTTLPRRWRWW